MDTIIMEKAFKTEVDHLVDLSEYVGKTIGITEWIKIEQKNINEFATATLDPQWIHTDAMASEKYSPYGAPVAHGFLILSLIPKFTYEALHIQDAEVGLNYGLDKVRFPHAVTVDSLIRGKVELQEFESIEGGAKFKVLTTIEIQGLERPACVAEFIVLVYTESLEQTEA